MQARTISWPRTPAFHRTTTKKAPGEWGDISGCEGIGKGGEPSTDVSRFLEGSAGARTLAPARRNLHCGGTFIPFGPMGDPLATAVSGGGPMPLGEFSFRTRAANLQAMAVQPLDILVVGGGIVGAWVALTAARRGLRTALLEKGDFASGTSGKTSRLLHCGLRYLRQFSF